MQRLIAVTEAVHPKPIAPNGLSSDTFSRARPVHPWPDGAPTYAVASLTQFIERDRSWHSLRSPQSPLIDLA